MNFKEKIDVLNNNDRYIGTRLDGRVTESPIKVFKINHQIKQDLQVGDTIEIGRIQLGDVIGIIFDANFKDVVYSIGISTGSKTCLGNKVKKNTHVSWIAPYPANGASVYLTIEDGTIERGKCIMGAISFC